MATPKRFGRTGEGKEEAFNNFLGASLACEGVSMPVQMAKRAANREDAIMMLLR